jgi:glutaredoxin 3
MSIPSITPKITIYTRPFCGFCSRAINLLRKKGVEFTEIEAGFDPAKRLDGAGKFDPMLHA